MANRILAFFEADHLSPELQQVADPFHALANKLERELPDGPEKSVALRHLLDSKTAAVRAHLDPYSKADVG